MLLLQVAELLVAVLGRLGCAALLVETLLPDRRQRVLLYTCAKCSQGAHAAPIAVLHATARSTARGSARSSHTGHRCGHSLDRGQVGIEVDAIGLGAEGACMVTT